MRPLHFEPLEDRRMLAVVVDLIDSADTGRSNLDNITNKFPQSGDLEFVFPGQIGLRPYLPGSTHVFVNGVGSFDAGPLPALSSSTQINQNPIQPFLFDPYSYLREGANLITVTTEYLDLDLSADVSVGLPPSISVGAGVTTDELVLQGDLTIWIDTVPPTGNGQLHPDSDSGAITSDNITSDATPSFFGTAEANSIVSVKINGSEEETVATPLDGNSSHLASVNWQIDTGRRLPDGKHGVVFEFEDVAGNTYSPNNGLPTSFFVDTQGPRVTDVQINNLGNPYNLLAPSLADGPTPLVDSLVVKLSDLAPRDIDFLYDAVFAPTATDLGHYQVVGDSNGIIPIDSVTYTPLTVAPGEAATGYLTINFAAPLPDDRFTLTIADGVVDPAGNALDGESVAFRPPSAPLFPSGDGQPGGDFVARFNVDSRPEIGVWSAGSVAIDTNGNFFFDAINTDAANRDMVYTSGFATDHVFAGDFDGSGFEQLAAYHRGPGGFEWRINDDFFVAQAPVPTNGVIGIPVSGNFNGNSLDGDEVGVFTGSAWLLDTSDPKNFQLDTNIASDSRGLPVVGDFDGDGLEDLGTYNPNSNTFVVQFNSGATSTFRIGSGFPFIGVRERPVAADMDGDGIDDLGLWVPDGSTLHPTEAADWYFFVSRGQSLELRVQGGLITYAPTPFGNDFTAQFGDEFAIPLVGNFRSSSNLAGVGDPSVGAVNGFHWEDTNGDGLWGASERGRGGVTVYLDLNDNNVLDGSEPVSVTRSDGAYWFTGLAPAEYTIREVLDANGVPSYPGDPGFEHIVTINAGQTVQGAFGVTEAPNFGHYELAEIRGYKWRDTNGNGAWDANEPGINGVTVYLDLNHNDMLDGGEPQSVTMNDGINDGAYAFTQLVPSDYTVREVPVAGELQSYPNGANFEHVVTLTSGLNLAGRYGAAEAPNFGNFELNELRGYKWRDTNGDGVWDPGESGLNGVTIYLDLNSNRIHDAGEPESVTMNDGSNDGAYSFDQLPPGDYAIREIAAANERQSFPGGPSFQNLVTITSGMNVAGQYGITEAPNFGNYELGEIRGYKWEDANGDGVWDPGEPGVNGVTIYLDLDGNDTQDPNDPVSVTMNDGLQDGAYSFTDLSPGEYTIREKSTPLSGFPSGPDEYNVTIASGQTVQGAFETTMAPNFGNYRQGAIKGYKWEDINGNGNWDWGEQALVGVTIYLDLNNNNSLDPGEPVSVTSFFGEFAFTELQPDDYTVREVLDNAWQQSYPGNPSLEHLVTVASGQTVQGVVGVAQAPNFGNFSPLLPLPLLLPVVANAPTPPADELLLAPDNLAASVSEPSSPTNPLAAPENSIEVTATPVNERPPAVQAFHDVFLDAVASSTAVGLNPDALDVQVGDFDGDGRDDIAYRDPHGVWYVSRLDESQEVVVEPWTQWGPNNGWHFTRVGDFNGDQKDDIASRASWGWWYVAVSNGSGFDTTAWVRWSPSVERLDVMVGDFNGDGRDDITGRTTGGTWFIAQSDGTRFVNHKAGNWSPGIERFDVQVGDFNGDGRDDIIGRTANGHWYAGESDGVNFVTDYYGRWTGSYAMALAVDLDGDGKDDLVGLTLDGRLRSDRSDGEQLFDTIWSNWPSGDDAKEWLANILD